ncbi:MAG: hypothetical protein PHN74_00335 [Candidatus Pacebacteria bacterium]|nr:hypothetical protein [Candidatus Paceibacterota bacterium]
MAEVLLKNGSKVSIDGLAGEMLEEIGIIINSGKFEDAGSEIGEKEKVLGDMTDLEKAMDVFMDQQHDKAMKLMKDADKLIGKEPKKEKELVKKFNRSFLEIKTKMEIADTLMWMSVRKRFPEIACLSIRKGFKVVEVPRQEGLGGVTIIRLSRFS